MSFPLLSQATSGIFGGFGISPGGPLPHAGGTSPPQPVLSITPQQTAASNWYELPGVGRPPHRARWAPAQNVPDIAPARSKPAAPNPSESMFSPITGAAGPSPREILSRLCPLPPSQTPAPTFVDPYQLFINPPFRPILPRALIHPAQPLSGAVITKGNPQVASPPDLSDTRSTIDPCATRFPTGPRASGNRGVIVPVVLIAADQQHISLAAPAPPVTPAAHSIPEHHGAAPSSDPPATTTRSKPLTAKCGACQLLMGHTAVRRHQREACRSPSVERNCLYSCGLCDDTTLFDRREALAGHQTSTRCGASSVTPQSAPSISATPSSKAVLYNIAPPMAVAQTHWSSTLAPLAPASGLNGPYRPSNQTAPHANAALPRQSLLPLTSDSRRMSSSAGKQTTQPSPISATSRMGCMPHDIQQSFTHHAVVSILPSQAAPALTSEKAPQPPLRLKCSGTMPQVGTNAVVVSGKVLENFIKAFTGCTITHLPGRWFRPASGAEGKLLLVMEPRTFVQINAQVKKLLH